MAFDIEEPIAVAEAANTSQARSARQLQAEAEVISLFEQFRDRLMRYLSSFGLPTQDSEEIVQEAFLALFRHLDLDRPNSNLAAWLFQVVHNMALKRQGEVKRSFVVLTNTGVVDDYATDPTPNAEESLVQIQTHERLRSLIRKLPEQDRRCLALRAEGLRYREIAKVLDVSLGTVSLSLARSLARLTRVTER